MTDAEIRQLIVDALKYASVYRVSEAAVESTLLDGKPDMSFEELELDSLATMELCIALEANAGVSIVPDDLVTIGTVGGLVDRVREALA